MARIRSVHPGQWKDGDFVACSPLARLLCLAIRNIADDRGAFRWKPTSIKMECLPGDNCDIEELLAELVENAQVITYEVLGKKYGLIKDFTQWQRPKSPNAVHPISETVRKQFGIAAAKPDAISETVARSSSPVSEIDGASSPHDFRNGSEIAPQREEVRGRRKEEGDRVVPSSAQSPQPVPVGIADRPPLRDDAGKISPRFLKWAIEGPLWEAGGQAIDPIAPTLQQLSDLAGWIEAGADFDLDVIPAIEAKAKTLRPRSVRAWGFFAQVVANAVARRTQRLPEATDAWDRPGTGEGSERVLSLEEMRAMQQKTGS